ncbi:MAG: hypothetical protein WC666_03805 [Candidatus Paceibacterota bacterium]|jgi:hypothetical protein
MANKKEQERIEKLLNNLGFMFNVHNFEKEIIHEQVDNGSLADISYEENYQRLTLRVYPCFFKQTIDEQRKTILHELCHTITLPLRTSFHEFLDGKATTKEQIKFLNERETSILENLFDLLLKGELNYAKEAYKEYVNSKNTIKKEKRNKRKTKNL